MTPMRASRSSATQRRQERHLRRADGNYATVSNYPGHDGRGDTAAARFDPRVQIIDTPGVNSLTPNSEDERVTRDILLGGVDLVVQVADAKNLPRALVLTLQIAEAGMPFVLVLNMMDEAADRGMTHRRRGAVPALGVPVVPTVAVTGRGLSALARSARRGADSPWRGAYPAPVEDAARPDRGTADRFRRRRAAGSP